jgi:hypothetical protein
LRFDKHTIREDRQTQARYVLAVHLLLDAVIDQVGPRQIHGEPKNEDGCFHAREDYQVQPRCEACRGAEDVAYQPSISS